MNTETESGYSIILCTFGDEENAKTVSKHLVNSGLVACCNIIPKVISIYKWDKQLQEQDEFLVLMKTKGENFEKVTAEIIWLHKYNVPEIIMIPIISGNKAYLDWIDDSSGSFL